MASLSRILFIFVVLLQKTGSCVSVQPVVVAVVLSQRKSAVDSTFNWITKDVFGTWPRFKTTLELLIAVLEIQMCIILQKMSMYNSIINSYISYISLCKFSSHLNSNIKRPLPPRLRFFLIFPYPSILIYTSFLLHLIFFNSCGCGVPTEQFQNILLHQQNEILLPLLKLSWAVIWTQVHRHKKHFRSLLFSLCCNHRNGKSFSVIIIQHREKTQPFFWDKHWNNTIVFALLENNSRYGWNKNCSKFCLVYSRVCLKLLG